MQALDYLVTVALMYQLVEMVEPVLGQILLEDSVDEVERLVVYSRNTQNTEMCKQKAEKTKP